MSARFGAAVTALVFTIPLFADTERQSGKIMGTGRDKPMLTLDEPRGGWTVDRMIRVKGTVSDPTINPLTVSINGDRYLIKTNENHFSRAFPVSTGKNTVVVQGTNAVGTARVERTVFARVSALPMLAVLTSDTDGVYTDLHVYEPLTGLKDPFVESEKSNAHVFWSNTTSPSGGKFYLNEQAGDFDSSGYGPYLYSHAAPPKGIFRIDANYWPSGDKAHTVATLNVVLFGGTSAEIRRTIRQPLVMPGETRTLAFIQIGDHQSAKIYAPVVDEKPKKGWPEWVLNYDPRQTGHGSDAAAEGVSGD